MKFEEIIYDYYDNALVNIRDKSSFKNSVLHSGFTPNRAKRYHIFANIIKNDPRFCNRLIKKINDYSMFINSSNIQISKLIRCVKLAADYINKNSIQSNVLNYLLACAILIEFYKHGLIFNKPITIYDIIRYYLVYISLLFIDDVNEKFDIYQSKTEMIEFGNIMIYLPVVDGYIIKSEMVYAFIKFSNLSKYLNANELQHIDFKIILNKSNEQLFTLKPSFEEIEGYVDYLEQAFDNFIIIEGNRLNDKFTFVQAVAHFTENNIFTNSYYVETQCEMIIDNNKILRQYGLEVNRNELLNIFNSFILEMPPDISQWKYLFDINPD